MNNFIHWYPGHIAKAERELRNKLGQIDVILEVLDARIPMSSRYQNSNKLTGNKRKIVLLNKSDVADFKKTSMWISRLENEYNCPCIPTNVKNQKDVKKIINKILEAASPVFEKLKAKGLLKRPIRVMVIGMPNVGKSSVINKLTGCAKTKTGAKAGVTRCQQWVRVHDEIELLDTPGIIPTTQDNQTVSVRLAMVNSVSENAYDNEFVAEELLKLLDKKYKEETQKYYNTEVLTLHNIALSRNWIVKGGKPDITRTAQFVLTNFRDGKIGQFTLEDPDEY